MGLFKLFGSKARERELRETERLERAYAYDKFNNKGDGPWKRCHDCRFCPQWLESSIATERTGWCRRIIGHRYDSETETIMPVRLAVLFFQDGTSVRYIGHMLKKSADIERCRFWEKSVEPSENPFDNQNGHAAGGAQQDSPEAAPKSGGQLIKVIIITAGGG